MSIRDLLFSLVLVCAVANPAAAQFTVTAPNTPGTGTNAVKAAEDFATRAFQDPWDMSQRTDVGFWLFGTDNAVSTVNWTNPTFSNGIFSGTSGPSSGLFLLESGLHETTTDPSTPIGKTGKQFPLDANTYTHLVYRMSSSTGFQVPGDSTSTVSQFVWSNKTIYDDQTLGFQQNVSTAGVIRDWAFYDVNLATLEKGINNKPWSGSMGALQFIPNALPGSAIQIDWIRLVQDDPTLYKQITWTGGQADIYLDNDNNPANGNLGRVGVKKTSPYSFFVGALPAGDYYVAVASSSTNVVTPSAYSSGFYRVNAIPTLNFTTPSDEGSADDFATARLGNPWDFKSLGDIDRTTQIQNGAITTLDLMTEAGVSMPGQTVYLANSTPATPESGNVGDPYLFNLFWDNRGKVTRIDPGRYRILTVEMGIPNLARSLPGGSIGRVVWRAVNEPARDGNNVGLETVGQAWVINHKAGENTLSHVTVDLNKIPIVPSSAAQSAWNSANAALSGVAGGIDSFRFDPHEFSAPTPFFMKKVKIASLERTASNHLTFRWNYSKASGTVDLYREPTTSPRTFSGGVKFASAVNAAAGSYNWDSTGTPDGEYQIYAIFTDGTNSNRVYAPTPIVVDANNIELPQIVLNRSALIFGALGPTRTPAQTVRLTFTGNGSQCWNATTNNGNVSVSPSSGTGAANLQVSIPGSFAGGTSNWLVTITSCGSLINSRAISVTVNALNTSAAPSGAVDTPTDGQVVTGSVGVTGWAVDDIGLARVTICRDAVPGEILRANAVCGGSTRIYIGDATFIDDARPDIETASSSSPSNYRAGWGYLMLTNFLPSQGNGLFVIAAYGTDVEGKTTLLGSKVITAQNSTATKPFGALDTPGQGEVVCGSSYNNFGWVLTQAPKNIPSNSSTITVYIDSVPVGRPGTLVGRADIQALFPGSTYSNPNASAGAFTFDTTQYANGVHSIFWVVTDSSGLSDGIGSRFFTISNPCSGS